MPRQPTKAEATQHLADLRVRYSRKQQQLEYKQERQDAAHQAWQLDPSEANDIKFNRACDEVELFFENEVEPARRELQQASLAFDRQFVRRS